MMSHAARSVLSSPDLAPLVHAHMPVEGMRKLRATCKGARDTVDANPAWGVPIVETYRPTAPRAFYTVVPYEAIMRHDTNRGLERSTVICLRAATWGVLFGSDAAVDRLKGVLSALLTYDGGCQIRLCVASGEALPVAPDSAVPGMLQSPLVARVRGIAQWYFSNVRRKDLHRCAHLVVGDALFMGATKCKRESVMADYLTSTAAQQRASGMGELSKSFSQTYRAVTVLMAWYHGRAPPTAQYNEERRRGHVPAAGLVRSLLEVLTMASTAHVRDGRAGFKTGWFMAGYTLLLERILMRRAAPPPDGTTPPPAWYGASTLAYYNSPLSIKALQRMLGPGMYTLTDIEERYFTAQKSLVRTRARVHVDEKSLQAAQEELERARACVQASYVRQLERAGAHAAAWDTALGPRRALSRGDEVSEPTMVNISARGYPLTFFRGAYIRANRAIGEERRAGNTISSLCAVRTQLYKLECMTSHFNVLERVCMLRMVCGIAHDMSMPGRGVFTAVRPFVELVRSGKSHGAFEKLVCALQHTAGLGTAYIPTRPSLIMGPYPHTTAHVLLAMGTSTNTVAPDICISETRRQLTLQTSVVDNVSDATRWERICVIARAAAHVRAFNTHHQRNDYAFDVAFVISAMHAARAVGASLGELRTLVRGYYPESLIASVSTAYGISASDASSVLSTHPFG